jgi:acetyl-CoA carboxylase biotin carboxyl carrier protein
MFAVPRLVWQWEVVKPFVLLLAALLVGMLLAGMLAGAAPEPVVLPPGDKPAAAVIVSPWAGTFCASEYPGGQPLVRVGTKVAPDTIVGIVDATMRPFPIPAGIEGTIVRVLVTDGQMVHAGQPLFYVLPAHKPE